MLAQKNSIPSNPWWKVVRSELQRWLSCLGHVFSHGRRVKPITKEKLKYRLANLIPYEFRIYEIYLHKFWEQLTTKHIFIYSYQKQKIVIENSSKYSP